MPNYTVSGRIVALDGTAVSGATVDVIDVRGLDSGSELTKASVSTGSDGRYIATWSQTSVPVPWDLLVRATLSSTTVESPLISDPTETSLTVDLVLGAGNYEGLSEWERVVAKLDEPLGSTAPKDVPAGRLEWLARRADVFPAHLAAYIQAHRIADGRTVKPQSCYAFLRCGLPSDLRGLVRAGETAWAGALREAWLRHIIPLPGDGTEEDKNDEVVSELAAMRELLVDATVATPTTGVVNQRVILNTTGLSEAQQRTFTELWLQHGGDVDAFWTAVAGSSLSGETDLLEFTVQAATLVGAHVPTLTALQAERSANNISTVADTAAWSVTDWDDMLVTRTVTPPDTIPGTGTAQRQSYARALFNILEDAYPSASLRASIAREVAAPPSTEFVVTFLTNNPNFDIVQSTVGQYLAGASSPWTGIDSGDQAQARANLETLQRVYRLTPRIGRYATTKILLEEGITSATQVVGSTRTEFVAKFGPLFVADDHDGDALAGATWDNAAKVHSTVVAMASQLALAKTNADFVPVTMPGSEAFTEAPNGLAELSAILGNLDYCACEHCRSVFSPAAYLADLLGYLQKRPAQASGNALSVLLTRRPDLQHILLDCANTNTVLPYIDLVNELLEDFIQAGLGASSKQTTWTEAELRLHPEHLDATVYEGTTMTQTVHPWTLPFSLPTVEAQTYLRHLGVPRHELMRRFAPVSPSTSFLNGMAADLLNLDEAGFTIIAGDYSGNASSDDREYWGFVAGTGDDGWDIYLATHVRELLVRGRLELDELRELIELDFINPTGSLAMQWDESCSLDDASVVNLEAVALDRIHRFVRLQHATQIPSRMLNLLVRDVLGGTLNAPALRSLADIVRVKTQLRLNWDEVATFWADVIDARAYTKEPRSLYTRRFLGKDFGPADPNFESAGDGTLSGESAPPIAITAAQLPRVLAGLGIRKSELDLLAASELTPALVDDPAGPAFSFANFTALFRCVTLARALRLSVSELVRLAGTSSGLTGMDPFATPAATLAFIDQVAALRDSGFSTNELDWLLRHEFTGTDPLDEATVGRELATLARGQNTIETEVELLVDPDGGALRSNLLELLVDADVTTTIDMVNQSPALAMDQAAREAFLESKLAGILDVEDAKDILANYANAKWTEVARRRAWLLTRIVGHLRRRALILDTIAEKFGLAATVAQTILDAVLHDPAGSEPKKPLFEVFRLPIATEEQIVEGLTPSTHANIFAAWTKLAKAAMVCQRFDLRADQVAWYSGRGTWLDLDALPLDSSDTDASFAAWEGLRRALQLRKLSRPGELAPAQIADATTLAEAIEILADHAGWDPEAVLGVATNLGYDDDDAAAVAEETIPERLHVIVETGERLGVGLDVLFGWATTTPTMTQTTAIKAATRAKYGEERWPDVGKPLRDEVRERQRDALVDAAIAITPTLRTSNDVFEHLLIDVEMGHCMMTSRIKQAIASVQIFIHRVLLHLEVEEVTFDPEAIERWGWMKNYRVWEANRKVFLYPENWIEPELRRDKTPEFEELEATLMQGVLDQHRVEKALSIYLEKLARVANLEMISTYQNPDTKELWVLARTHAAPHEWFIRRRLASQEWTAWEVVPHSIESDAAIVVVNKGRVHLFWANEHDAVQNDDEDKNVPVYYTIGHIEKSPEGWGKVTVSERSSVMQLPDHEQYRLNFLVLDRTIYLYVFYHNRQVHAGNIGAPAAFYFEPVTQRIRQTAMWGAPYTSEDEELIGEGENQKFVKVRVLTDNKYMPLSPTYEFEGQRNRKWAWFDADVDSGDVSGAKFSQGWVSVELFQTPSGTPTFLHQADMLVHSDLRDSFLPAIYDDRRRKYVLQPDLQFFNLNQPNPSYIGQFTPSNYATCPTTSVSVPERSRSVPGVRMHQDDVRTLRPWSSRVPGRRPALATIEGVDSPDAPAYSTSMLLNQSKEIMQGSLALVEDDADYPQDMWSFAYVLQMEALYHPFALSLQEALASDGVTGLYAPPQGSPLFRQLASYDPLTVEMGVNASLVHGDLPIEEFDFDFGSPYATYNWEIFYHVPMLIAGKLATEQKWDEAQSWYHLMFNPIELVEGENGPSRFWRIKPFFEQAGTLAKDQFEVMLGIGVTGDEQKAAVEAFARQVAIWEDNPFDPHAVARVRPGVYQRALLREYFDNLIAWADNLFRRDTIESITEATVLYIVVAQLLGQRPQDVPGPDGTAKSFAELDAGGEGLDAFANALMQLESWIHVPTQPAKRQGCGESAPRSPWVRVPVISHFWYFCYPPNPELLKYWDIVEDRLFKIRHCQNIDGVERQLPLFEPPIDPALLVQATAAGVDIQSVLAELDSGLPPYRFRSVHARAMAFTNTLERLGSALLSALEKQDAEELSRIRSSHELEMLARVRDVRVQQRDEAAAAIAAIERGIDGALARKHHYTTLMLEGLSKEEDRAFELNKKARSARQSQQAHLGIAGILGAIPQVHIGMTPSMEFGGLNLATIMNAGAAALGMVASEHEYHASKANTVAGYKRRAQDWEFQYDQAFLDVARMQKDLIAAQIRLAIAERELANHDLQTEHARSVDEYMRTKFTNRELYDWMIGQLSTLYFQTYQLAFDLAKRAERAYRHELAIDSAEPSIIKFGYWDSLRKGLLAGEKLGHDLERLDLAYMDRDIREFELRKSISLATLNPDQLRSLQETGECNFTLPEALFDLDHPGHYLRRIRAVRLTIPAVVGPYTTLGARLQLESHITRIEDAPTPYEEQENDGRFRHGTGAGQAIATSTAMADGGLFNLDFRDERYLPFEYSGAVSSWKLTLPKEVRQFDYRTIEDVIVHIDYTARDGGEGLRTAAEGSLADQLNAMLQGTELPLAIAVHEAFPNEWEQFFTVAGGNHVLTLPITEGHFPYFARRNGFNVTQVDLVLVLQPSLASQTITGISSDLDIQEDPENLVQATGEAFMTASFDAPPAAQPGTWTLTIADSVIPAALQDDDDALDPTKVVGLVMVIRYTLA